MNDFWNPNADLAAQLVHAALEVAEAARRQKLASEGMARTRRHTSLLDWAPCDLEPVLDAVLGRLRGPDTWALTVSDIARDCRLDRRRVGEALGKAARAGMVTSKAVASAGGGPHLTVWQLAGAPEAPKETYLAAVR